MLPEDLQPELPKPVQQGEETSTFKRERFAALAKQKAGLRIEGLKLYEPLPNQEQIHRSNSSQRICRGGNRCLGTENYIYDPVKKESRKIGEIDGTFHVNALNERTGNIVVAEADKPYCKGTADLFLVTLSNGESFTSTAQHRVLTLDGWREVSELAPGTKLVNSEVVSVEFDRHDSFYDFEVFVYSNYIHAGGVVSHNSGKTTSAAVEIARAALWCDPYDKYPKRPLLIYLVGYDQDHIGRVFHRALFRPGLFKMIRDEATGEWRAFRPSTDSAREKESKLAPPLIPARMVEEIAWVNKRERIFSVVRLKNGTEIRAFSSKSDPAQGDPVDLVWIDEDLFDDVWVTEMQARLSDRKGKLLWSAFPHSKNDALITLSQRARDPENLARPIPDVFETILVFSENPFMDEDQKRMRRADFASMSEEELNARDRGEFITESVLMYPAFNIQTHGAPHELDDPVPDNPFDRVLRETGQIPADWTRYVSIDPGHSICCCLFFAVPPPHRFGEHVLLYDELYIRQCTAGMFGRAMAERTSGHAFQAFIIDEHGSRVTEAGTGKTIKMQYAEELRRNRVESVATGSGFIAGSDDRHGRSMMARTWMQIRDDGTTKFRVLKGRCPNFIRELPFYRKSVQDRLVLDVANPKTARLCHAMAAFEYMVAYQPQYKPPMKPKTHWSPAYALFMADEQKANRGSQGIWLGAGSGRN